jgi:HK97 family phage prohead protease
MDKAEGLAISGKLVLESDVARKAYALMKAGAVKGLSIGYQIAKDAVQGGSRILQELKLHEVSVVTFPMNPQAAILAVKEQPDSITHKFVSNACFARELLPYLE